MGLPVAASTQNQLADKAYVEDSIRVADASFRGSYATVSAIPTDYNDYPADSSGNKGFSDKYLSKILKVAEKDIRNRRKELGIKEAWLAVPVSGVENANYYYSTYNAEDKSVATDNKKKIMILGGEKR